MEEQKNLRVLVVEDEADIAEIYRRHLTKLGCEVTVAQTGEAALAVAPTYDPDIAFVDTMLPDMLGTTVVEGLRADGRTARCTVIVASGLDPALQDVGADGVMSKPFSGGDLRDIIDQYVPKKVEHKSEIHRPPAE